MALAGEGARVRLAADAAFAGFVAGLAAPGLLEFFPLGGDAREMMGLTVKWGCVRPAVTCKLAVGCEREALKLACMADRLLCRKQGAPS